MTELPLRRIKISDFRRLDGTRNFSLDAPVVLIHGPNGTGKTSVLSALELALTGEIRSMFRQDPRYTAHLPFQGQDFATLSVEVSEELARSRSPERMTVGGSRIEGEPALDPEARQFYSERCYLDQVSLGQLLDLYQYREGKEESALARFVNELLGLEQLDALRSGLAPAADYRNLKRATMHLAEAELEAKDASADVSRASESLSATEASLAEARSEVVQAAAGLGLPSDGDPDELAAELVSLFAASDGTRELEVARDLQRALTSLGGRLSALSSLQSVQDLNQAGDDLAAAVHARDQWRADHQATIQTWVAEAAQLGITSVDGADAALEREIASIDATLSEQSELASRLVELQKEVAGASDSLAAIEEALAETQAQAGSLAEGLAALRPHLSNDVCPLCGRDFAEVSNGHLSEHVEAKINDLTTQGMRLRETRTQRDAAAAALQRLERLSSQVAASVLPESAVDELRERRSSLDTLKSRLDELSPLIARGRELLASARRTEGVVRDAEAAASEARDARSDLEAAAVALDLSGPGEGESLREAWERISERSNHRVDAAQGRVQALALAHAHASRMQELQASVHASKDGLAQAANRQRIWDARVAEAKRRQRVAREVERAASAARAEIVQRVFTESLNDVWQAVFARLAPRESFVPEFGIPSTSKSGLELALRTVHSSGDIGGSPQMMLSAGNLNTAALSLFIALHLGVKPVVPCLVFDDPVQSMDEVHISQFAGLMRVLSKHHGRQIVIAVHERELFEYLTLELSPAFEGDELLTIELGRDVDGTEDGSRRHTWVPDVSIAV